MDFQQSKTYLNLLSAYQSELISTSFYLLNADRARDEGFNEIGDIFDTISRNEKEHARIWQRNLNNQVLPNTEQNLLDSANREIDVAELYRDYASTALSEGYSDIAALFKGIANIELNHDLIFRTQYNNVVSEQVFCKPTQILWICMQCGNIMNGVCAPEICPVCGFPQGYYRPYSTEAVSS